LAWIRWASPLRRLQFRTYRESLPAASCFVPLLRQASGPVVAGVLPVEMRTTGVQQVLEGGPEVDP